MSEQQFPAWEVDEANREPNSFWVDTWHEGGITFGIEINRSYLTAAVMNRSSGVEVDSVAVTWGDLDLEPDLTMENPWEWRTSENGRYGYLEAFGAQVFIDLTSDGVVIHLGRADATEVVGTCEVPYAAIAAAVGDEEESEPCII